MGHIIPVLYPEVAFQLDAPLIDPQGAVLIGCCSFSVWIAHTIFVVMVPNWTQYLLFFSQILHTCFINSDSPDGLHLGAGPGVPCGRTAHPGHVVIAFSSTWQSDLTRCDVSVCPRYLSQNKGNCVLFQAARREHSSHGDVRLNAARLHYCRS